MRDRLVELIAEGRELCEQIPCEGCTRNCKGLNDCIAKVQADHLLSNGVIVPPYKCGTAVYVLRSQTSNGENLYMRKERIDHYRTFNKRTFMIFESGRVSVGNDEWSRCVFATLEEAEQALRGEQNAEIH